jgi:hypothetical protein
VTPAFIAFSGLLADETPRNTGPDFGKASPIGLLIVVLLLIGTILLVRSMNRHLRKLPGSFDRDNPEADRAADGGTVEPAAAAEDENKGPADERGG